MVITAGVDVQQDRLESTAVGHGYDDELWFLGHEFFYGPVTGDDVWNDLRDYLLQPGHLPSGTDLRISCTLIDSGYETQRVYAFCKRMAVNRVFASKGVGGSGRPAVGRPSKSNFASCPVFPVGTNTLKEVLFSRLKVSQPGPRWLYRVYRRCDAQSQTEPRYLEAAIRQTTFSPIIQMSCSTPSGSTSQAL